MEKTAAAVNGLVEAGQEAVSQGIEDVRSFASSRDAVVAIGGSAMGGAPFKGNSVTSPGTTIVAEVGIVADLSSVQFGVQGSIGAVPSVGGGAVASGNFQAGLNDGPLSSGASVTNTALGQVSAVTATGTPVSVGGAVNWSDGGVSVSGSFRPGVGSYIGAGGGPVMTGTLVTPPLRDDQ